ncbi:flagellar biosynthetic protein FliO [Methylotenera sp. 1P/1]|uniref:flagellar biosynthetic protein FliO n=1 Tax=Methylotenera sp. 1P/1 TaxID=1131551 RepID=UPI000372572E|nr:flagellar biosynthetic protein FliO [Methylotenera sp. 1P/1]
MLLRAFLLLVLNGYAISGLAATANAPSPTMSVLKMVMGLVVVLGVMALFAWGAKKFLPGVTAQPSVIKVVGGVSVGTRERVVVLEVAGRWLVVGVANGQVNSIANVEPNTDATATLAANTNTSVTPTPRHDPLQPFTNWLKQAMQKNPQK